MPKNDITRHGVVIREHKNWNTKTIYNRGHVMRIYRRQPKKIQFSSPMVNDFNQHLCGGWSQDDILNQEKATIEQLVSGRKPFACLCYWEPKFDQAQDSLQLLRQAGFATQLRKRHLQDSLYVWDVTACHDIRVRDIGDLEALIDDYSRTLPFSLGKEIRMYADTPLTDFLSGWDSPPLPLWLTGLILGYPVENTISIYLAR